MPIPFETRLSLPSDVLVQEIDDQSVILNLKTECYLGLDDVGTRMWKVLSTAESVQAAYEILRAEYDVEPEVLRRDLEELVDKLLEQGLLEVKGGE